MTGPDRTDLQDPAAADPWAWRGFMAAAMLFLLLLALAAWRATRHVG